MSLAANQAAAHDGRADHESFRPADAGPRAELGVAALDELAEERRIQARRHGPPIVGRLKLAGVAIERSTFLIVLRADVDHERRLGRVVDEVVAEPLGLPRLS